MAEAIREVVSMSVLTELKDPRIRDVTVTYVEVSGDLRHAKVHVSVMGDLARQQLSLRGLKSAAGFLQAKCASRIDTRYTPKIEFVLDQGVKKSIEISRLLAEVLPCEKSVPPAGSDEASEAFAEAPEDNGEGPSKSDHPPPDASTSQPKPEQSAS